MKKFSGQLSLLILGILIFYWPLFAQDTILPIDQIKIGMKGKGKTVFVEDKIEEFDVEILGVIRNYQPKRSLILAKLKGSFVDDAGVIQGMSGSPVYVNGKLIGAVAYSIGTFPKEALAGITPIGEMLSISGEKPPKSSYSVPIPVKKHITLDELYEMNKSFFSSNSTTFIEGQAFVPLHVPLVFSGFSTRVFEKTKPIFKKLGFNPIKTGASNQPQEKITFPDITLEAGDPVAAQLISGDMNMSAIGTVTHVDGENVLAFGHPLYNLGAVDYAMTKAKVLTVAPSLDISFKIASADALVGRFSQDRSTGVFGELGKMPRLIPLNVKLINGNGETQDIKTNLVDDKILTPFLVNSVVSNILLSEERALGDLSLGLRGNIFLENGMSIQLEDFFSGTFDTSATNLSSLVTSVIYFLTNNEYEDLGIHRIDLDIHSVEEVRFSYLEKVWLDKYDVSSGETISIKIYTRSFGGQSEVKEGGITVPLLPSGSEFYLIVADAASMHQIEIRQYRTQSFVPRSLNQLIRILNNLRKNNRIYVKIVASKPGLFLRGEEMPNLPPTMKSMFSSPRAATSAPTELNRSTLSHYQLPVSNVFRGIAIIPLRIK